MIKFIHGIIFKWIWVCTWIEVTITSLFILGGLGYGIILINNPSLGPDVPLYTANIIIGMVVWTLLCLAIGFLSWVGSTLHLIMLGYYTRPQAWPEHYGLSRESNIEEMPATQFNKAIYSR